MPYVQSWTAVEWMQVAGGLLFVILGGILFWKGRAPRRAAGPATPPRPLGANLPVIGHVSEATRLVMAISCLAMGYHLIVWAFPPHVTPIQSPRTHWWVLVGVLVVLSISSVGLDRMEAQKR